MRFSAPAAALVIGFLLPGARTDAAPDPSPIVTTATPRALPAHTPRPGHARPLVAVVGENTFTELTDYVVPYGVIKRSGVADVVSLGTQPGPMQMFPALPLQPEQTTAAFDTAHPEGADYVIVPAVHRIQDPALIAWVKAQSGRGATVVGVCDGVWVLAHAGLLDGKRAVGHWYAREDQVRQFPRTTWVKDRRYLADGRVITTTGVTASIPVSLALVEAMGGTEAARTAARAVGAIDWTADHRTDAFSLDWPTKLMAGWHWIARWSHDTVGIPVADGVDEVALALTADAHARTWRTEVRSLATSDAPVRTRHGLTLLPDVTPSKPTKFDHRGALKDAEPAQVALDRALAEIRARHGERTARFVEMQMEYAPAGSDGGGGRVR